MLRRAPTTITLTQADVEQWEASRQRKLHEAQQKLEAEAAANQTIDGKPKESRQRSPTYVRTIVIEHVVLHLVWELIFGFKPCTEDVRNM
ncbi:hypothetical protein G6011_07341 [Alternaria panax]|uniref:Uncharacterized protein n=1 Tax=Alternaria panax TaxID=48097 RepID=A0AAD4I913_9PLEO|nr:hypothetical protein G6011_07341 [Alternaria panax]